MLFLPFSHPIPLSESFHHRLKNLPSQHSKNLFFTANSPLGSLGFSTRENPVALRSGFHAKATRTEDETGQNSNVSKEEATDSKIGGSPAANSFLSLLCPLLKFFGGGDPSQERNDILEAATSSLSSLARLPWGSRSLRGTAYKIDSTRNTPHLQLYEFEACPFCRRVREAMTELDLSVEVYPCPKGSIRHREMVRKIGGKEQFPFLVDLNTGVSLYESGDIVKYLFQQYGEGRFPSFGLLESTLLTGWVPTLLRAGRGMTAWGRAVSDPPLEKLELFSYENHPYARIVREALCELELAYVLHNVGEGSSRSLALFNASGSKTVPYLIDPNAGVQIGDYKNILSYLFQTYSVLS